MKEKEEKKYAGNAREKSCDSSIVKKQDNLKLSGKQQTAEELDKEAFARLIRCLPWYERIKFM